MEDAIKSRLAELEQELAQFTTAANRRVSYLEGAIAELKALLAPKPDPLLPAPPEEAPIAGPN